MDHLEQLVRKGRLQQFLYRLNEQRDQSRSVTQGNTSSRLPLGTINVIFAALGKTGSHPSRVMSVTWLSAEESNSKPKKARVRIRPVLSFSNEDKMGTIQQYDDALVVTLRI